MTTKQTKAQLIAETEWKIRDAYQRGQAQAKEDARKEQYLSVLSARTRLAEAFGSIMTANAQLGMAFQRLVDEGLFK